jgi:hypothetical protein
LVKRNGVTEFLVLPPNVGKSIELIAFLIGHDVKRQDMTVDMIDVGGDAASEEEPELSPTNERSLNGGMGGVGEAKVALGTNQWRNCSGSVLAMSMGRPLLTKLRSSSTGTCINSAAPMPVVVNRRPAKKTPICAFAAIASTLVKTRST